jgi:hypothetical protein
MKICVVTGSIKSESSQSRGNECSVHEKKKRNSQSRHQL